MGLLTSCEDELPSLHPIVQEQDAITLDSIEGNWIEITNDDDQSLERAKLEWSIIIDSNNTSVRVDSLMDILNQSLKDVEPIIPDIKYSIVQAANLRWYKDSTDRISDRIDRAYVTFDYFYKRAPRNFRPDFSHQDDGFGNDKLKGRFEQEMLNFYYLSLEENTLSPEPMAKVMITKIGRDYYLDFEPLKREGFQEQNLFSQNFITGHSFAKLERISGDQVKVKPFNSEYIAQLIKERRVRLKHEVLKILDKEKIVITASTHELRAFINKFGDREELYQDEIVLGKFGFIQ